MGLSAPKNRSRISNDPQNTTWANNTSRFGHRILTSQGWTPGSSLGATDAAHAAHYTVASQSHIRVLLKDDNLGLGAKRGSERAENFGLAGLESVLGRLNGRIEEVKKEEERQEKIQQRAYVYRKYGFMNFVSGGFLVGDKIEKGVHVKREVEVKVEAKSEPESSEDSEKKSKKRKQNTEDNEVKREEQSDEQPKLKRKKKSMNLREEVEKEDASSESISKRKKEKKEKKDKKDKKSKSTPETSTADTPNPAYLTDKAIRKAEKRARKEEKKLKKALKRAAKEAAKSNTATEAASSESEAEDETTPSSSTPTTGTSTPASGASGLTYNPRGMHAVRQRYIRQKQMASMDPQALKEIFMIKTPS